MDLLKPDDESIALVFPGVRQYHDGKLYREGRTRNNLPCFIDASDSRKFELSGGTFSDQTLHVHVTEEDGTQYRAGEKDHFA
jgi:hypothetical protein